MKMDGERQVERSDPGRQALGGMRGAVVEDQVETANPPTPDTLNDRLYLATVDSLAPSGRGRLACVRHEGARRPNVVALTGGTVLDDGRIPGLHGRYPAVVAEDIQGPGIEQEVLSGTGRQSEPARCEHTQHVSVGKERHVALDGARPGDHAIHARADLRRCLAARASVAEDQPPRRACVDLRRRQGFVLPVVPLDQIGINDSGAAEARQLAGLSRALQGADENERERLLGQYGANAPGQPAPVVRQGDVRRARVLPAQTPLRLPMSDGKDAHADLLAAQTLSASVEPALPAAEASCPHLQPAISGMSSPCRAMYCLCSISLSRIACLA